MPTSADEKTPLLENKSSRPKDRFSSVFAAAVTASLASLCFGFTLGFTSPTESDMENDKKLNITKSQFSWFAVSSLKCFTMCY